MKRHKKTKPKPRAGKPLHEPVPDAAGIDLGAIDVRAAVTAERCQLPIRRLRAFPEDLNPLGAWLVKCGTRTVEMEATGVYWIPLYHLLSDANVEVCLVNA